MSNASALTPVVSSRRLSERALTRAKTESVSGDQYILSLPLCRGSVRLECDGGTIFDGDVRPGMLRIMAPGELLRVQRRSPAEAVVIAVPGPLFRQVAAEQEYRTEPAALTLVAPITRPSPQVERLSSSLLGLGDVDGSQRPLFLQGITLALLALAFSRRQDPAEAKSRFGLSDAEFSRCIDFADAHLDASLDLSTWAASLGLSLSDFVRRFQQTTHVAPYAWFLNWRIDRAKQLLETSDLPLVDVALQVGFCSQSHFTEAFRRRTGASPGRWRKQIQAESR